MWSEKSPTEDVKYVVLKVASKFLANVLDVPLELLQFIHQYKLFRNKLHSIGG